jgi:acyl transferase domain-containing protein
MPSIYLLPLSATSLSHLQAYCRAVAEHLRQRPAVTDRELVNLCGTAALHRSRFAFRKAFVAKDAQDLASQLEAFADQGKVEPLADSRSLRVAMVLTGQGSQYAQNGLDLMDAYPVYRQTAEVGIMQIGV